MSPLKAAGLALPWDWKSRIKIRLPEWTGGGQADWIMGLDVKFVDSNPPTADQPPCLAVLIWSHPTSWKMMHKAISLIKMAREPSIE